MTPDDLRAFTTHIAEVFNAGEIKHPIHLSDGNEDQLIEIFKDIKPEDWVLGSWRMHYHALLHNVSREMLEAAIRRGESMALSFPERRVYGSAIVGGTIPIAVGIAMGIKRAGGPEHVHCFVGDMTAETGIFHEARSYAFGHSLPVRWIVEDNDVSVCTNTEAAWGTVTAWHVTPLNTYYYHYKSKYPHAGAGFRVQF